MSVGLDAFSDELGNLTKEAGPGGFVLRGVGKAVRKKPLHALGALATVLPAVMAGSAGYKRGRAMGQPARYLRASRYGPSAAFWTNWHRLLRRKKLSKAQRRKLHEHYRAAAYRR